MLSQAGTGRLSTAYSRPAALLVGSGEQPEEGLPDGLRDRMQPPVDVALARYPLDVAVLLKEAAAPVLVPAEQDRGDRGRDHHLGGRDLGLRGIRVAPNAKEVVAQAVNRGDLSNLAGRGRPPAEWWVVLLLYQRLGHAPGASEEKSKLGQNK